MAKTDTSEARYLLLRELRSHGEELSMSHPWVWEGERWKELVFAILTQVSDLAEDDARELATELDDLELLDIPALAGLLRNRKSPDLKDPLARHLMEIAQESGLSPEQAKRGAAAICEAALALDEQFGGRVQNYLRGYGETMLRDMERIFHFSALSAPESRLAFAYWLQNVLNMPVSLLDSNVQQFCKQHGLKPSQLIAAADELDLNLAVLDDLVQYAVAAQKAPPEEANGSPE
jgi:hypothetical protein